MGNKGKSLAKFFGNVRRKINFREKGQNLWNLRRFLSRKFLRIK